jgi:hypothetical protein
MLTSPVHGSAIDFRLCQSGRYENNSINDGERCVQMDGSLRQH